MTARHPTWVQGSFSELAAHGGDTGHHADGWGLAAYEGLDARLVREAAPAARSPCARLLASGDLHSPLVVAHVRRATRGAVTLANTQPFARQLGGRMHVFAHNGDLPGIADDPYFAPGFHRPVGDTDSEVAFGALLRRLEALYTGGPAPDPARRRDLVVELAEHLRPLGPANFLYADGEYLFAHGHRRHQADGTIRAPGLHLLQRHCRAGGHLELTGLTLGAGGDEQSVTLVASVPLSEHEAWRPLAEGEVVALWAGEVVDLG